MKQSEFLIWQLSQIWGLRDLYIQIMHEYNRGDCPICGGYIDGTCIWEFDDETGERWSDKCEWRCTNCEWEDV